MPNSASKTPLRQERDSKMSRRKLKEIIRITFHISIAIGFVVLVWLRSRG